MKKINCGGFYINEDNFEITDDGELKLKSGGGSGGGAAVVPATISGNTLTINEKAGSLMAKCESGPVVVVASVDGQTAFCAPIVYAIHSGSTYTFVLTTLSGSMTFVSASADDYPTCHWRLMSEL